MKTDELIKDICKTFNDICPNGFVCFCGEKGIQNVPDTDIEQWKSIKDILEAFKDEI